MTAPAPLIDRRVTELEALVRELLARIAVLEAERPVREDGPPRPPGRWLRMKAAAKATGRSVSGLKKLCRQGRIVFDDDAPRRLINIDTVPRRTNMAIEKTRFSKGTSFQLSPTSASPKSAKCPKCPKCPLKRVGC
jgi:hypothetical protein